MALRMLSFCFLPRYGVSMRKTISDIKSRKTPGSEPLVWLTAYTAPMASLLDPHCDVLLVGDSVSMVLYGHPSTLQADLDMMIRHGQAVMRASQNALVVVDMPFGTYQESKEVAFRNAARILQETGAAAVKMEGGAEMAETIAYLSTRGVPVVGHVGLLPQSVNTLGGYKAQGRDDAGAAKILDDAKAIDQAGAFALVIEGVAETLAVDITKAVNCPTIGIGASAACDGQVLVAEDMLGMTIGKKPKFVKTYADIATDVSNAVAQYAKEVKARSFPSAAHTYGNKSVTAQPQVIVPAKADNDTAIQEDEKDEPAPAYGGGLSSLILRATPRKRD